LEASVRLYKATVSVDVVFFAEDDVRAARIAADMAKDEVQDSGVFCVESCEPINTVADVPGEWLDCIPRAKAYRGAKEQTVAEILEGK
jgi:hypothetical protein